MDWLGFPFMLVLLYTILLVLVILKRNQLRSIADSLGGRLKEIRSSIGRVSRIEKALLGLTIFILLITGITILFSQPAIYDSLTYRLPRIGFWLQHHSIQHFNTFDERQNWMSVVPDLMMLWVTAHQSEGFWGVQFVQWIGGLLTLLSIYSIGKSTGLSVLSTRVAGLMFLCLPNVFVQLMSSHTDLITAGFAMSGLAFLLRSLKTNRFHWQAGAAWALAFGSKGVLYYWVLGLPLLLAMLTLHYKAPFRIISKHAVSFSMFALILVLPRHLENMKHYGNPFANQELVERHHPDLTFGQSTEKFFLNGLSYGIQLLDPQSNPAVLAPMFSSIGTPLTQLLPEDDRYLFDGENRRKNWSELFSRVHPDADGLSLGAIITALAIAGGLRLVFYRGNKGKNVIAAPLKYLAWSVILFLLYFCYKQNAHLYAYRYFVLMAAPIAVIAASLLEVVTKKRRNLVSWAMLAFPLIHLPYLWASTNQVGLNNALQTDKNRNLSLFRGMKELLTTTPGKQTKEVVLNLPYNFPIAGFFASDKLIYAKEPVNGFEHESQAAMIIPIEEMHRLSLSHSGRSFLYNDGTSEFSCALIDLSPTKAEVRPFIYGYDLRITPDGIYQDILLYRNGQTQVELTIDNPSPKTHRLSWKNGKQEGWNDVNPGANSTVRIPVDQSSKLEIVVSSYLPKQDHKGFPDESVTWKLLEVNYPVTGQTD